MGGVIPTRSLGLPDEYQYDEFGRRFTYVVDKRATMSSANAVGQSISSPNTCYDLMQTIKYNGITQGPTPSTSATTPAILIENTTGGTVLDQTMVAYISHGASGYGAFPEQGGATRLNSGSTDADMQNQLQHKLWQQ